MLICFFGCSIDVEGIPENPFTNPETISGGENREFAMKRSLCEVFTQEIYDYYDNSIIPNENGYANIIYIDPGFSGDPDGSLENPYRFLHDAPQKSNTAYLLKRGTSYLRDGGHYAFQVGNILIGSYGEGDRPVIEAEGEGGIMFHGDDSHIRDLEVSYVQYGQYKNENHRGIVFNVKMRSAWIWGIDIRFIGCEVKGAGANGIFVQQMNFDQNNYFEVGYSHIHKVNQNWTPTTPQTVAWGDGIQISSFRGKYHIHNSIIDKSDTGNKFTIIVNAFDNEINSVKGIIEDCYLYGPMPKPDGGAIVYLHNNIGANKNNYHSATIRNNVMVGSSYDGVKYTGAAVYSNGASFEIYGNYVSNCAKDFVHVGNQFGENKVFDNTVISMEAP